MADPVKVYSTVWCPDCKRAKKFLGELRVPYENIDMEQDESAMAFVEKVRAMRAKSGMDRPCLILVSLTTGMMNGK